MVGQPQALCLQPPCGLGSPPPNSSDPFYALTGGRILRTQKPKPAAGHALVVCVPFAVHHSVQPGLLFLML